MEKYIIITEFGEQQDIRVGLKACKNKYNLLLLSLIHIFLHRQVEILPVVAIVSVSVVLHLVGLVVWTTWVVHHHQEGAVPVSYTHLICASSQLSGGAVT